ncbi:MAG: BfmA/BtgA family mobilization protein [Bacteroidales bacterium]
MSAKNEEWKSIKVEAITLTYIKEIADKEGLTIKDCVRKLALYFLENHLSLSQEIDSDFLEQLNNIKKSSDSGVERIIKIIRSVERDFILPMNNDVMKILSHLEVLMNKVNKEEESDESVEVSKPSERVITENNQLDDRRNITLKRYANGTLEQLESLLNRAMQARPNAPFVISMTLDEKDKLKTYIENVRNDLTK